MFKANYETNNEGSGEVVQKQAVGQTAYSGIKLRNP